MGRKGIIICIVCAVLLCAGTLFANRSEVSIEAPASAVKNAEITIRLTVTHKGNSAFHYTKWLKVEADGVQIARWDYTGSQRPEAETFTKDVKVKVTGTMQIVAEASCNLHGSAGPEKVTIQVRE
jgi:desulfoferrodoxin (superoxide reductase-like protein)